MIIKKATIKDIEITATLFDFYRQFYEQPSDLYSAKKFLSERIKKKESVIFLAIDEGNNSGMGFVQLYPAFSSVSMKRIWILNDLFVQENYRSQGVAKALIYKSGDFAAETNAKGIILETHNTNTNAQKLYDKTGFKKDNEHYYFYMEVK